MMFNGQNCERKSQLPGILTEPWNPRAARVFNASGFDLRAIASPVNSQRCRAIPHNSAQFENSCAQFRATEFRLETLLSLQICLLKIQKIKNRKTIFLNYFFNTHHVKKCELSLNVQLSWFNESLCIIYIYRKSINNLQ